MGKIAVSEPLIIEIRKIGGKMQSLDGTNWTDEMTLYHILEKYKEYETTKKEKEIEKIESLKGIQEAPKRKKRRN